MAEWFKAMGERAMKHIDAVADQLAAQAAEAQATLQAEQSRIKQENEAKKQIFTAEKPLPWEAEVEELTIFENDTMEKVLQLSLREENFTVPPRELELVEFEFSEFIPVALRLLQLDANLARMHARLSSKMDEETFWQFYHYRIAYIRASIGIDGPAAKESALGKLPEDGVVIFQATQDYDSKDTASSVVRRRAAGGDSAGMAGVAAAAAATSKAGGGGADEGDEGVDVAQANRKKAEAALAAEVQAELEAEDDLINLDDFGADDDLGVLAMDGGSGGLDDDLDAELEAQIARELEEN